MGWFDRLLGQTEALHLPKIQALGDSFTFNGINDPRLIGFLAGGRDTAAGVTVGERNALRNSTFFRAVNLIASSIGMLPIHLMRKSGEDTAEARDNPLFAVLHDRPNDYQTALEFKTYMQATALLDGNAYAYVIRGTKGIIGLVPLPRRSVEPLLSADFQLTFRYSPQNGAQRILQPGEVFHFRSMLSVDGLRGLALLDVASESLGLALQADLAAARLFKNGSLVQRALKTANKLSSEARQSLKDSFSGQYSGADNAGKTPIFEEGLDWSSVVLDAVDAQLIEARKYQAEEMSRFTGAPRPLLMFDETSWGTGIEQLGQFFVTYCLSPWFVAWEQAITRSLDPKDQGVLYAKFNEGALLRGSLDDQASFFAKALGSGGSQAWMTPNEVRGNFDLNNIDDGDKLPARTASKASADPSAADPPAPKGP